ncbi:hypothetical protein ACOME3_000937 [Neoechinorhynchus agilis]
MNSNRQIILSPCQVKDDGIIHFKNQDYHELVKECVRKKHLFKDEFFLPEMTLAGQCLQLKYTEKIIWRRPSEVCENPVFLVEKSPFGLTQSTQIYNCWFVTVLVAVMDKPQILRHTTPPNQSFSGSAYCGIFRFRFYQQNHEVEVVVDDRLPFIKNTALVDEPLRPLGVHNAYKKSDFWAALFEKAYAKLYGSYCGIHLGHEHEAFNDIASGVTERIKFAGTPEMENFICYHLIKTFKLGGMVTASTSGVDQDIRQNRLVNNHSYTILGIELLNSEYIILTRNPWNVQLYVWNDRFSWSDPIWHTLNSEQRARLKFADHCGTSTVWMPMKNFIEQFDAIELWHQSPSGYTANLNFQDISHDNWIVSQFYGTWVKDLKINGETYVSEDLTPRLMFKLSSGKQVAVHAVLTQLYGRHRSSLMSIPNVRNFIRLDLYRNRLPSEKSLKLIPFNDVMDSKVIGSSGPFTNLIYVSLFVELDPGVYSFACEVGDLQYDREYMLTLKTSSSIEIVNIMDYWKPGSPSLTLLNCEKLSKRHTNNLRSGSALTKYREPELTNVTENQNEVTDNKENDIHAGFTLDEAAFSDSDEIDDYSEEQSNNSGLFGRVAKFFDVVGDIARYCCCIRKPSREY